MTVAPKKASQLLSMEDQDNKSKHKAYLKMKRDLRYRMNKKRKLISYLERILDEQED